MEEEKIDLVSQGFIVLWSRDGCAQGICALRNTGRHQGAREPVIDGLMEELVSFTRLGLWVAV